MRVFVEGREVGEAPVALGLPPGRYRVAGLRGGVRVGAVVADLSSEDAAVQLDVSLAEALRPDGGPGLALPSAERAARLIACSGRLQADRVVAATLAREGEAEFLLAAIHDVRRGSQEREGKLRLRGGQLPPGGLDALAVFLVTGRGSALLDGAPGLALPAPAAPAPLSLAPRPKPGDTWHTPAARATLLSGLALGGVAVWQLLRSNGRYDDARAMLDSTGRSLRSPYTLFDYSGAIRDGDRARAYAVGSAVGAGVALGATAVIGWLSWKETGEVGIFRF